MTRPTRPVLIEIAADDAPASLQTAQARSAATELTPATAPPIEDLENPAPQGAAMQMAARLSARRASRVARLFWSALLGLLLFVLSAAAWGFATSLLAANPILGWIVTGLFAVLIVTGLLMAGREVSAYRRLGRLDQIARAARAAQGAQDLAASRKVLGDLDRLYAGRPELAEARKTLKRRAEDAFDAETAFAVAERVLMGPLDARAAEEVAAAARQVATITALVPLALADVVAALTSNLRMIRRIAEVYGGRAGTFGSWRLTRTVLTHLVATGAVAVGDDLIGSFAGGGVLSKISRRFGEGLVNGALTARVGVAAMEVCRPLPFSAKTRPSTSALVKRALGGLFGKTS